MFCMECGKSTLKQHPSFCSIHTPKIGFITTCWEQECVRCKEKMNMYGRARFCNHCGIKLY